MTMAEKTIAMEIVKGTRIANGKYFMNVCPRCGMKSAVYMRIRLWGCTRALLIPMLCKDCMELKPVFEEFD